MSRGWRSYWALMAKASAVPLPVVLLAIDAFHSGDFTSIVADSAHRRKDSVHRMFNRIIRRRNQSPAAADAWQSVDRFDLISPPRDDPYSLCWYPMKFLIPTKLSAFYLDPERAQLLGWTFAVCASIVAVSGIVFLALRASGRYL
ncbi:MAG: hypothetical protein R3E58_12725 [Phycisphaerae bacterium]